MLLNEVGKRESTGKFSSLTESESIRALAKSNRAVLKNVISLFQLYRGEDPQLTSKEAEIAMKAILASVMKPASGDPELYRFGRMQWEPDNLAWISFFDQVGDRTLADFLGISSSDEIPPPEDMAAQFDQLGLRDRHEPATDPSEDPSRATRRTSSASPQPSGVRSARRGLPETGRGGPANRP